jgi:hypothetical protein
MTTTQIIVAFCSFSVFVAVSLIGIIYTEARKAIKDSVAEEKCAERRCNRDELRDNIERKLCHHHHNKEGKVEVEL